MVVELDPNSSQAEQVNKVIVADIEKDSGSSGGTVTTFAIEDGSETMATTVIGQQPE